MDNQEKEKFVVNKKHIPLIFVLGVVIAVSLLLMYKNYEYDKTKKENAKTKYDNEVQQIVREYEANQREREAALQRQANIALNPLKVKSLNFVCSRLSVTELLKILIKYDTRNASSSYERDSRNNSLRYDISMALIWDHNAYFSDTIAEYIVGEDIYFQMPNETTNYKANVSPDEIIRIVVESIYIRKSDLQNIPASERSRSYLTYEINTRGDIEHKIIRK
jgi:hypothetical protein